MKIRQLSEEDVKHLTATYTEVVALMHRSELDAESILGVLFKAAVALAISIDYDKDDLLSAVAATYHMERAMRPSSDEVH
jgi:hypothetical protein